MVRTCIFYILLIATPSVSVGLEGFVAALKAGAPFESLVSHLLGKVIGVNFFWQLMSLKTLGLPFKGQALNDGTSPDFLNGFQTFLICVGYFLCYLIGAVVGNQATGSHIGLACAWMFVSMLPVVCTWRMFKYYEQKTQAECATKCDWNFKDFKEFGSRLSEEEEEEEEEELLVLVVFAAVVVIIFLIIVISALILTSSLKVEISEHQINQDSHAIKSFLIAHKRLMERSDEQRDPDVQYLRLMERSDEQRDPDVQYLSVLGFAYRTCTELGWGMQDLYRARLGDAGALAVYRAAHRPRVRRGRGEEEPGEEEDGEEEEAEGGEEGIVPAEDSATEQEGEAVFEGPALPPWLGIEAIFDNPQDEEEEEENEEEVEDMDSQKSFRV
eukprot:s240_g12.t1